MCGEGVRGLGLPLSWGSGGRGSCFRWRELLPYQSPVTQALCSLLPAWLLLELLREHGAEVPVSCPHLQVPI